MKFIVDAQLPRRLAMYLTSLGHDVRHTLDLPNGNRTTDAQLNELSVDEERILITKDFDFVNSLLLQGKPHSLLLVATGNIGNAELIGLFNLHLASMANLFGPGVFVEMNHNGLIVRQ